MPASVHVTLPRTFVDNAAFRGSDISDWVAALPGLLGSVAERWHLAVGDGIAYGEWNLLVPAIGAGGPCMLKVFGPGEEASAEITALRAWDGAGAVRVLEADADAGVMVLEQLHAERSLSTMPLPPAAEIAGGLARTLAEAAAPAGLPRLTDVAALMVAELPDQQHGLGDPVPRRHLRQVLDVARELATDVGSGLVHGDLHYGNVLAADRQPWLAIDPKPYVGHPERSVPELMWTRLDEADDDAAVRSLLTSIVTGGRLDPELAVAWTVVRATAYWLWGLGAGLTEDPLRCRRLLEVFL